ncbi:MAG: TIGR03915 family putative DNA repair protein [Lachnospiraceae bacterium]|nr:TIGR03915 family putative DNA repair protein [Lachnospiraceae bacterium]
MELCEGKTTRVYECENSLEGILTGIYRAWDARYGHEYIRLTVPELSGDANLTLFCEYYTVEPDAESARRVARSVREKTSQEVYETMLRVLYSGRPEKADAVYHFLPSAFRMGKRVLEHLTDPYVRAVFEMNRHVSHEAHEYEGFLRFEETRDGILMARFRPKNDLLELVTPHFEDRFSGENFIIYDTGRGRAAFHRTGYPFVIRQVTEEEMRRFSENSEREEQFQSLWTSFFETIAIEERKNTKLQRNMLPLHYRRYMTEMNASAR